MSEAVKVIVRCRPLNKREKGINAEKVVFMNNKEHQVQLKRSNPQGDEGPKVFTFDAVFDVDSRQQDLYEQSAFPLVEQVFEGYNGTMFAYGQTGCGKSFTMMGEPDKQDLKGVIPRVFDHIINIIDSDDSGKTYLVMCAYIEIYNEEVRDLLGDNPQERLDLKEDPQKGVYVKGLNKVIVKTQKEMDALMNKGNNNRVIGETAMNAVSSRSHSIFTVFVETQEQIAGEESFKAGKLNLVDLAGSEKQSKTKAEGARLKEATKINLSLSALGNVISALSSGKGGHIPYRDSKLTRLLQDSLGGNTKTIMMAALSPAEDSYEETLSTLRYAARTKTIKNKPVVNMDPKDALLKEYQDEINQLKAMLAQGGQLSPEQIAAFQKQAGGGQQSSVPVINGEEVEQVKNKMNNELQAKEQQLLSEKEQREQLEQKLKELENNQLQGGQHQKAEEDNQKYKEMKTRLKKQKKLQEKMLEDKKKREKEILNVEKNYQSLQEEVEELRKVMKELKDKYQYQTNEIKDLEREHEAEKEDLLDTIRMQQKEHSLNSCIIDMLLSTREYEILKSASNWNEDKGTYIVPPFTFKDKKIRFPKLAAHQAMELVDQEKENRDIDFEADQSQQYLEPKSNMEKRQSRYNTIQGQQNSLNSMDNLEGEEAFYNNDSNTMRGRTHGKNIRITKMQQSTRQKFYSANPHGRMEDESPQKMEKKNVPSKLQPLNGVNQDKIELIKQQLNHTQISQSMSPEKHIKQQKGKNGVQLNPLNHNPIINNNSEMSNFSGIMNTQELKKHNGLAPLNHKGGNGNIFQPQRI